MKNRLINTALRFAGNRLDGKKTYAGAAGKILTGIGAIITGLVGLLGTMFPDLGFPALDWEAATAVMAGGTYAISSGLEGIGIGHKIEKVDGQA